MTVWNLSSFLQPYLIIAAILFIIGFFGLLYHRTIIGMLISGELILASVSLNLVAFSRFLSPEPVSGQVFTLFIMGLAAAEACIVLPTFGKPARLLPQPSFLRSCPPWSRMCGRGTNFPIACFRFFRVFPCPFGPIIFP